MKTRHSFLEGLRARGGGIALLAGLAVLPIAEVSAAATVTDTLESRFGDYQAVTTIEAEAERYPELNRWHADVLDAAGALLYRLERTVPYDTPYPALALSDEGGASVLLNAFDGIVEFIDTRGATVRRWRPFASETPSHERILKCSMASSRVTFLVSDPLEQRASVHAMTIDGTLHASADLAERQAGELYLTDDGTVIVAGGSTPTEQITRSTVLITWDGRILATVPLDFRLADLRVGTRQVFLADTRTVLMVDLDTGDYETLWSEDRPGTIITRLLALEPGVVAISQVFAYGDGIPSYADTRVVLVSRAGVTLMDRSVGGESRVSARVDLGAGGIRVSVGETTTSLLLPR